MRRIAPEYFAIALSIVCVAAFLVRFNATSRFEVGLHANEPHFNFRATQYLVNEGPSAFFRWLDESSWAPSGRRVGETVNPALMFVGSFVFWLLRFLHFPVDLETVCVFLPPLFAPLSCLTIYLFACELSDHTSGLFAAGFLALAPGYLVHSGVGRFENESVAIFFFILSCWLWVRALGLGSTFAVVFAAASHFLLAASWGGSVFLSNLIPLHVLALILLDRFHSRTFFVYGTWYFLSLSLMLIPVIGSRPLFGAEYTCSLLVFVLSVLVHYSETVREFLRSFSKPGLVFVLAVFGAIVFVGVTLGLFSPLAGRFLSALNPASVKAFPLLASSAGNQPSTWAQFFFDLHILVLFTPVGMYLSFKELSDARIFLVLLCLTSLYFAAVAMKLMVLLVPAACVLSAIAVSTLLQAQMTHVSAGLRSSHAPSSPKKKKKVFDRYAQTGALPHQLPISMAIVTSLLLFLVLFVSHSLWAASEVYSNPSMVLHGRTADGSGMIFDDFREAYQWLDSNTPRNATVFSWPDNGYHISALAKRPTVADGSGFNPGQAAQVARALISNETVAAGILRSMGVQYVLVQFGGMIGYASDDMQKFVWMTRLAATADPTIDEADFLASSGEFRVDWLAPEPLRDSLLYKLSYYLYAEIKTAEDKEPGYDRVRNAEILSEPITLSHFSEAFTSEHWLVRIYKVNHAPL